MTEDALLPQQFCDVLRSVLDSNTEYEHVMISLSKKRPLHIRINPLRLSIQTVLEELDKNAIEYCASPIDPSFFLIPRADTKTLTSLPSYQSGGFYIQSLSSMIPALVLAPLPGEIVLDMCAAPGSKTSQIAAMMQNTGTITANDVSPARIFKLKAILATLGVTNVTTTCISGQRLWETYPASFDKVLLDAPCSMEGRFIASDPSTYSHWSPKKVKNLSRLQRWLLRSALSCAKTGGIVVYSTCTISPEENEEVIDWVLNKERGHVVLEAIDIKHAPLMPGLTKWKSHTLDPSCSKTARIVPSDTMEGFFVAKLRKISSNLPQSD